MKNVKYPEDGLFCYQMPEGIQQGVYVYYHIIYCIILLYNYATVCMGIIYTVVIVKGIKGIIE